MGSLPAHSLHHHRGQPSQIGVHEEGNSIISSWHGKQQRKSTKTSSATKTRQAKPPFSPSSNPTPRPSLWPWVPPPRRLYRSPYLGNLLSPAPFAPPGGSASWDEPPSRKPPGETKPSSSRYLPRPSQELDPRGGFFFFSHYVCLGFVGAPVVLYK